MSYILGLSSLTFPGSLYMYVHSTMTVQHWLFDRSWKQLMLPISCFWNNGPKYLETRHKQGIGTVQIIYHRLISISEHWNFCIDEWTPFIWSPPRLSLGAQLFTLSKNLPQGIVITFGKVVCKAGGAWASHFGCKAITRILLHSQLWNLA